MLNLLGGAQPDSHLCAARQALSIPGARIYLYGKGDARPGRKMGHITILADSMSEAERRVNPVIGLVDRIRGERMQSWSGAGQKSSQSVNGQKANLDRPEIFKTPLVAVTMGSDSDRFVLTQGIELLKELEIPFGVTITSAHRTPERMIQFARNSASKGIKVIIAAAGGAAHLPGMIAANTWLPVIGVPVKGSSLDGMDSLLSIVQMPVSGFGFRIPQYHVVQMDYDSNSLQRGCPVATVAINNSVNAAQLSARILVTSDINVRKRLEAHLAKQTNSVLEKADRMEHEGLDGYDAQR